ncbi:hypothetical protein [Pseudobacteriovorax antillogorgiicola]|uniref:Uncharacterized protein n=1 Tax=Pseudobacteriovorax antillogorgiicola TaxID=1513793 RepID=A0A1Y6CM63_9BACT|nr:hypothetical protein [Pseudobacteriovorax antillogorgiicola]TCS44828.1 hypothetical protein EDD56_13157 [Pseudobacteriovorax antillogorgiicola]SMF77177.1 hypothetical protein SAMN06296036_1317 [Pseudobacteriovorax antillogorgiicola]
MAPIRLLLTTLSFLVPIKAIAYESQEEDKKNSPHESRQLHQPQPWFPDWQVPPFDWSFQPIFSFRSRATEVGGVKTETSATEAGAHVGLYNITVRPEVPTVQLAPHAGIAWGHFARDIESDELRQSGDSPYNRRWYGLDLIGYYRFYRHQIGYHQGRISYDDSFSQVQNRILFNDFGLMVLPHMSAHLTTTMQTVFSESFSRPQLEEIDHWLHAQMTFDFLTSLLDIGPGITNVETYSESNEEHSKTSDGATSYLLARARAKFFWRFGLWSSLKYIVTADDNLDGSETVINQLPNQGLHDPSNIQSLPEDSLDIYAFIGIRNIIAGFGFGYRYSILTLNYTERQGRESQTFIDSGYTVSYSASI